MSNLVVPDVGKKPRIQALLDAPNYKTVHLFKNNATVDHNTVLADLTEADFSGYASITLSGGTVQSLLDASRRAVTLWNMVSWTKSGATGNTIYGYYYKNNAGDLTGVEKWDSPETMTTDGQVLQFVPQDTEGSQFSN
jgi:hypothetical protein